MKKVLINGIILDGSKDMQPIYHKRIFIKDGIIEKINEDELEDYEIIDLMGQYVMPGLINLHVHLPASGKPKDKPSDPVKAVNLVLKNNITKWFGKKLCESYAKIELLSGVTTIRTVGGVSDFDTTIRDEINKGKCIGPRILASNKAISVPGGHMVDSLGYRCESVNDVIRCVDEIIDQKADLVKLMITGGVLDAKKEGEPGELKMDPEFVRAACFRAHERGLKVAAHVESPQGVKVALENNVDTIEHGAKPDDEIIALFKQHHASLVATLSPALPYALFDQNITHITDMEKVNGNIVFKGIIDCAKACLENDIPVGLGTDVGCPYTTHYNTWRELYFFHHYLNVSNQFALYTATLNNAKIADIDDITGSIEVGKSADMIVTKDNPLDDLRALRHIEMVMLKGQEIHNPKVKKMKIVDERLDEFC